MGKGVVTYPWDRWFAKSKFTLTKEVDFFCMTHSMIVQVRNAAASYGKSVSIKVHDEAGVTKLAVEVTG